MLIIIIIWLLIMLNSMMRYWRILIWLLHVLSVMHYCSVWRMASLVGIIIIIIAGIDGVIGMGVVAGMIHLIDW